MTAYSVGKTFFSRLEVGGLQDALGYPSPAMSIQEDLAAELIDALKAKDQPRKDVIRSIETEVARAKSEPGFSGDVDDNLYLNQLREEDDQGHRRV